MVKRPALLLLWTWLALAAAAAIPAGLRAQEDLRDPMNPQEYFLPPADGSPQSDDDAGKSADELIREAVSLQGEERLLDARTKLLKALAKDPEAFLAHLMLAEYYLRHVGHFRLALKYVKQAQQVFEKLKGNPPYRSSYDQLVHRDLLNLISSIRLNLDDYRGALAAMDQYESYGYYEPWVPPHRAWILMKLGRLDEAIRTARLGMLAGAEPGQTLNILGILLSMTNDKQAALEILKEAVAYESRLGKDGRPATPLNNSGEVYREIFSEDQAVQAWLDATRRPDGCEHVLPSLNLAILYMEKNQYLPAKLALDAFEACMAQFPLKNGEEHRALVHMARGRIALHTGHADAALEHFEAAMERRQWFGKIGTSEDDLRAAVLISQAQALRAKNRHLFFSRPESLLQRINSAKTRLLNRVRAWWLMRRARQILTEDLNDLEDIYIRHTDSMLEYPALGEVLASLPAASLARRIAAERTKDRRGLAVPYYELYRAESLLAHGEPKPARKLLDNVLRTARPVEDAALRTRAMLLKLSLLREGDSAYTNLAYQVFRSARPELRNQGLRLPVNTRGMDRAAARELARSAFIIDNSVNLPCAVDYAREEGQPTLRMSCEGGPIGSLKVQAVDLRTAVNNFTNAVFTQEF